jgi:hypothetical protein
MGIVENDPIFHKAVAALYVDTKEEIESMTSSAEILEFPPDYELEIGSTIVTGSFEIGIMTSSGWNWYEPKTSDIEVEPFSVTENGTYAAEEGKAYSPVTVNIKSDIEKDVSESEWWDNSYLENITVEGNPLEINSPLAQNAISTILSFSPKQSGTGDPSPDNIRPIEGWTEANLGVNSETPTITISLGGTYYGFNVDLENGTVTVTHKLYTFDGSDDENWTLAATGTNRVFRYMTAFSEGIKKAGVNTYISNIAKKTTVINNMENTGYTFWYFRTTDSQSTNNRQLLVGTPVADVDMTLKEFKQMLANTPMIICAELATPQTITLTPQTVSLLKGRNTLWTDGDEISLTYRGEPVNAPLLGMLGNAVLDQNMEESEPTDEESNILTKEEENVSE